jgi:hypothetical protein
MPLMVEPEQKPLLEKAIKLKNECHRGGPCRLMAAALAWVYWNRHIAKYADARYKIDDLQEILEDVCLHSTPWLAAHGSNALANINGGNCTSSLRETPRSADKCPQMHGSNNPARAHASYTWQELKAVDADIAEMVRVDALKYGFADLSIAPSPPSVAAAISAVVTDMNASASSKK